MLSLPFQAPYRRTNAQPPSHSSHPTFPSKQTHRRTNGKVDVRERTMFSFRSRKQKRDTSESQSVRTYPSLPELTVSQGVKWPAGLVDHSTITQQPQPNELGALKGPGPPSPVRSARAAKTSFSADKPPAFHRPLWDVRNVNGKPSQPIGAMFKGGQRPPPSAFDKKAARGGRVNPRRGRVAPTFNLMVRVVHQLLRRNCFLNTRPVDRRRSRDGQDLPPSTAVRHSGHLPHRYS